MFIALQQHRSSEAPSGAKCLSTNISLLTELQKSGYFLSYKHLAPTELNIPYVELTLF
jgi:hypothetical protein